MAAVDWELNLFTADPRPLQPQDEDSYARAAALLAACAAPEHLKLLHALLVGERTPARAAAWSGVPLVVAERALRELVARGVVERDPEWSARAYRPVDGHVVAFLAIAIAHGTHDAAGRAAQPLLLRDRRRIAGTRVRDRE